MKIRKSYIFLYPLLNLEKHKRIKPIKTYMYCDNIDKEILICVYKINNKYWNNFNEKVLLKHELLENIVSITEKKYAYIFDLSKYKKDYHKIANGDYKSISNEVKKMIINANDKHFDRVMFYLSNGGDKINKENETCKISLEDIEYSKFLMNKE